MTVHGYTPACQFCRDNEPSYYKHCPGCENRRQMALLDWLKTSAAHPMPAPRIDPPKESP